MASTSTGAIERWGPKVRLVWRSLDQVRRRGNLALFVAACGLAVILWWGPARVGPALPSSCTDPFDRPLQPGHGMVAIPGGHFKMGSEDFRAEEAPATEVAVAPFWIDQYHVTNAQFDRFVRQTGYVTTAERAHDGSPAGAFVFVAPATVRDLADESQWWKFVPGANWRHPEGPASGIVGLMQHPVVQVSYDDAEAYANWVGHALPTEAEWEWAARGGHDDEIYIWGNEPDSNDKPKANVWRGVFPIYNEGTKGFQGTSPVGCFAANGFGLFDMAGNVWQWTADAWSADHTVAAGKTTTREQVIKGGSFLCATNFCLRYRPAARQPSDATSGAIHIGFRTVARLSREQPAVNSR